ncbi:hypothetical protein [Hyphomicrobium sp.]|uniref:hypothetical protein n=1 Tax=Hyphomicrobium sp. TaxID=82 RepID=UPI001D8B6762|nr:hypothetical protein [Hyphomicrobium sp.]MBY0559887.1 hypothetical protein [Hyphomicrobium sp.]
MTDAPNKVTLLAEKMFVIRSLTDSRINFYEARRVWNTSPAHATIFQSREAAEHVVYDLEHGRDRITLEGEELAIVPFVDAIMAHGTIIQVRKP